MVKISGLTSAASSDVSDDDFIAVVDNATGTTKKATRQQFVGAGSDYTTLGIVPVLTSSDGQKSYTMTYNGVDYTPSLQKGTKLRVPRTGTTPTQSMSFTAASSQYASKASPTGLTFTDTYSIEAWIKLTSYSNGQHILGRRSGSGAGWDLEIGPTGQLTAVYGDGTNLTTVSTYQCVPLGRWVHVAATISSVSSHSVFFYIDGGAATGYGVAVVANSLSQGTGALTVGAYNGGSLNNYFDGQISEIRLWNAARTAQQIRDNMGISLAGSETNLIALYQGNGNFNDKTTNANNLTAVGATSTQLTNPYNVVEYGIVTTISYTGGNTVLTLYTGTDCSVPNATLGTTSYSNARSPYGFPTARDKWRVSTYVTVEWQPATTLGLQFSNISIQVPAGKWLMSSKFTLDLESTTTGAVQETQSGIGAAAGSVIVGSMCTSYFSSTGSSARIMFPIAVNAVPLELATSATYAVLADKQSTTTTKIRNQIAPGTLVAECAYI